MAELRGLDVIECCVECGHDFDNNEMVTIVDAVKLYQSDIGMTHVKFKEAYCHDCWHKRVNN